MINLADGTDETARIRATIENWAGALRAKDADGVMAQLAPDYLHFSLAPPLVSRRADAEALRAWFATWQGPLEHAIHDLRITAGDDLAFCTGLVDLRGTASDGSRGGLWFRLTLGLRKRDGNWKIVHEHESVPFHMDGSYRAAVDLEP